MGKGTFPKNLCKCIAAGLLFDVAGDETAQEIQDSLAEQGVNDVLKEVTELDPKGELGSKVIEEYNKLIG